MRIEDAIIQKRAEILRIAEHYGVSQVRVFGSVARGEARPDSDLDLLVRFDVRHSLIDRIAFKQDLEDLLGCSVDVVTEKTLRPGVKERILQEARSL